MFFSVRAHSFVIVFGYTVKTVHSARDPHVDRKNIGLSHRKKQDAMRDLWAYSGQGQEIFLGLFRAYSASCREERAAVYIHLSRCFGYVLRAVAEPAGLKVFDFCRGQGFDRRKGVKITVLEPSEFFTVHGAKGVNAVSDFWDV